jgi:hypothetical protein
MHMVYFAKCNLYGCTFVEARIWFLFLKKYMNWFFIALAITYVNPMAFINFINF